MANSLDEYKLDDQILKLIKEAKKEVLVVPSAPLLDPPLNMYPLLSEK